MHKLIKLQVVVVALMALCGIGVANAFSSFHYTAHSKLSSGKWVKISIPETGVYEITYDELREMGFNNPSQVRLYGAGGARMNEKLEMSAVDDLKLVHVMRVGEKLCFYGIGPVNMSLTGSESTPHYVRTFNPYSLVGCYFLTEESRAELGIDAMPQPTVSDYINTPVSLDYFFHEKELVSGSQTGKEMQGENMMDTRVMVDYYLPQLADSTIVLNTCIAANLNYNANNGSAVGYVVGIIHSGGAHDTTSYAANSARIMGTTNSHTFYNSASPYAYMKLSHPAERGQFEPYLKLSYTTEPTILLKALDYFMITYKRKNIIGNSPGNQIVMGYGASNGNERFMLPEATSTTMVWLVTDPTNPMSVQLSPYNEYSGKGYCYYANAMTDAMFVAFDPNKTLKKVNVVGPVANQNLHGMAAPDLLIITDKMYHEQAERVAELHRAVDGISVAVVDQDEIFNEFSSGTRDAMGYRWLCKLLYDRNPGKLKNLLLFGTGSLDNREIFGKVEGNLLTYQSDNSNIEDYSYTSDDFFGILADNSGANPAGEKLSIGVGRFTCTSVAEARDDVDKLVEYYANPDYGVWRNNALVVSDSPDKGEYMFQGEIYKNLIDNGLNTGMHATTIHNSQYPRQNPAIHKVYEDRVAYYTSDVAKQFLRDQLEQGVYFATYVGHAGSIGFTKYSNLWDNNDVLSTSYKHLPIMSTSCCNVARFDDGSHGVAELMFHKRDGGAIALLTASRMVYSNRNHALNTNFIKTFFKAKNNGVMPTLGDVYRQTKLLFTSADYNKMKFFLLGDPAIKINVPLPRFKITNINGTDMSDSTAMARINPLQRYTVKAQVVNASGNLDQTFNGDATMTLYDKAELFMGGDSTAYSTANVYFNRPKLGEVAGRVQNGIFVGQMVVPRSPKASDETVEIHLYAHKDNSTEMVNGVTNRVTMAPYDESSVLNDSQAPVINAMFVNDETTFTDGAIVGPNSILYITASDNDAVNMQAYDLLNATRLLLDGGKTSCSDLMSYVTAGEDGKSLHVEYPLANLTPGVHTATFTICDLMGLTSSRTINFVVGQDNSATLVADKLPVYLNERIVNFDVNQHNVKSNSEFVVRVTDALGNLVWKTTTTAFPIAWNLTDLNGEVVKPGLYRYYGTYSDGFNYGGTSISNLIVLDPIKTSN